MTDPGAPDEPEDDGQVADWVEAHQAWDAGDRL